MRPGLLPFLVVAVALLNAPHAWADGAPTGSAAVDAGVPTQPSALPPLPKVPSIELPKPKKGDLADLDALLARLRAKDQMVRDQAVKEILEVPPGWVPAIAERLDSIADKADRDEMKHLLHGIRHTARKEVRQTMRAAGEKGRVKTPDYLQMVADHGKPDSKAWQDLVSVLGLSRMLVHIGSVDAVRVLIDVYVRFGEFLRVDTQLQLEKLGDKAVPALIEARRHPAKKIRQWADRELAMMGKDTPAEAIRTKNYQVLADVLRAYGRVRDPDAARMVISFANSERAQVRMAARQAVAMMGDVANWQLRETYKNIVGEKPPRDWGWKRTARELFGRYDQQRQALVYHLFNQGMAAYRAGRLTAMRESFDKVLARSPTFEHRSDMVPGYLAFAKKHADDKPALALDAARRAERLAPDDAAAKPIKSLRLTLEGERLLARGIADQTLFRHALDLDPHNARARDALSRIEHGELTKQGQSRRYAAAGAIGAAALLAIAFIGLWRPRRKPEPGNDAPAPERGDNDADSDVPASQRDDSDAPAPEPDDSDAPAPERGDNDAPAPEPDDSDAPAPEPDDSDAPAPERGDNDAPASQRDSDVPASQRDSDAPAPEPDDSDVPAPQCDDSDDPRDDSDDPRDDSDDPRDDSDAERDNSKPQRDGPAPQRDDSDAERDNSKPQRDGPDAEDGPERPDR